MCGGTAAILSPFTGWRGLSPRVRGNPAHGGHVASGAGPIPACAGEPLSAMPYLTAAAVYPRVCGGTSAGAKRGPAPPAEVQVYPRVCGGTKAAHVGQRWSSGLSPRVRGNPSTMPANGLRPGSIPACAGEPGHRRRPACPRTVYPRVCGGTCDGGIFLDSAVGSIPACAGEPGRTRSGYAMTPVYPRVCGGNRCLTLWQAVARRSIPACAGEPRSASSASGRPRVYPRVCGGTSPCAPALGCPRGLSPRVRGNRRWKTAPKSGYRSIPACAGEPLPPSSVSSSGAVYPRVCGGTFREGNEAPFRDRGLSPRVRGNL